MKSLTDGVVADVQDGALADDAEQRVRVLDGTEEHFSLVKEARWSVRNLGRSQYRSRNLGP